MADELNNPAAAAQRGSGQLLAVFSKLQASHLKIFDLKVEEAALAKIRELDHQAKARAQLPAELDALTRSEKENQFTDWLKQQGIENTWEIAPILVSYGYDQKEMSALADKFSAHQLPTVIDWLSFTQTIYGLLSEIDLRTGRIAVVKQLKRSNAPLALFLVDQRMPNMTGTEFLEQAIKAYPEARKVLLTAYADTEAAITSINAIGLDHYLTKPWHPPEQILLPVLDDLISAGWPPQRCRTMAFGSPAPSGRPPATK